MSSGPAGRGDQDHVGHGERSPVRRRRALWLTGLASVALLLVLAMLDRRLQQTGGPGIIPFEVAGDLPRARGILADWGAAGRDTARLSLGLDFAFLGAYGAFLALAATALRDMALRRGWRLLASSRGLVVALPVGAAALDAVENIFLLMTVGEHGGETAPRLAAIFAIGKFALLGGTLAYMLAVLVRAATSARRPSGPAG